MSRRSILCFWLCICSIQAWGQSDSLRVCFTHDLHGNIESLPALAGAIRQQQQQVSYTQLLVDAGDFSMGSFSQLLFRSQAPEYSALIQMGYDALCFGNHEFDFGDGALLAMLQAGRENSQAQGLKEPLWLAANIKAQAGAALDSAFRLINLQEWTVLERDGQRIGLFGLLGKVAMQNSLSPHLQFEDPKQAARRAVQALQTAGVDWIICLSHSGTAARDRDSEDLQLAKAVKGIDLIISGHSHSVLRQPLVLNHQGRQTYIVSAGASGEYLGVIDLCKQQGRTALLHYALLATAEAPPQAAMADYVQALSGLLADSLFRQEGFYPQDSLACLTQALMVAPDAEGNSPLGSVTAQAFRQSLRRLRPELNEAPLIGLIPWGCLRADLPAGTLRPQDFFSVLSLGMGADGRLGYPLVLSYLYGKELEDLCELNASVAGTLPDARLFFAGLRYRYQPFFPPFFRVFGLEIEDAHGNWQPVVPTQLYAVTGNLYTAQMLGMLHASSHGILSAQLKSAQELPEMALEIMYEAEGRGAKDWLSLLQAGSQGFPSAVAQAQKAGLWTGRSLLLVLPLLLLVAIAYGFWTKKRIFARRGSRP
jgi:5''-nucleotidase/2'',3''-cyclic phosphodiesterase and related esterases